MAQFAADSEQFDLEVASAQKAQMPACEVCGEIPKLDWMQDYRWVCPAPCGKSHGYLMATDSVCLEPCSRFGHASRRGLNLQGSRSYKPRGSKKSFTKAEIQKAMELAEKWDDQCLKGPIKLTQRQLRFIWKRIPQHAERIGLERPNNYHKRKLERGPVPMYRGRAYFHRLRLDKWRSKNRMEKTLKQCGGTIRMFEMEKGSLARNLAEIQKRLFKK